MQRLEVSCAVGLIYMPLGAKGLICCGSLFIHAVQAREMSLEYYQHWGIFDSRESVVVVVVVVVQARLLRGKSWFWRPAGESDFSEPQNINTGSGTPISLLNGLWDSIHRGQRSEREADHSPLLSSKLNNSHSHMPKRVYGHCLQGQEKTKLTHWKLSTGRSQIQYRIFYNQNISTTRRNLTLSRPSFSRINIHLDLGL